MSDKDLINSILNKNFIVSGDSNTAKFVILDKDYNKKFTSTEFIRDIFNKIIGEYKTNTGELSSSIFHEWFDVNKKEIIGDIEKKLEHLLNQLIVSVGNTGWRVTWVGHGELSNKRFKEYFKDENAFQIAYVKAIYEEWLEDAKINKSQDLMFLAEGKYFI